MEGAYTDKYIFIGEWYDNQATLVRRFLIYFFPLDSAIAMYDLKNQRMFLKRYKVEGVTLENFYIGSTVNILGRMVTIIDFACENSRSRLQEDMQLGFVMIKPIDLKTTGKIITHLYENGLRISAMKRAELNSENIAHIYRKLINTPEYPFLVTYLNGKYIYGLQLICKSAVAKCLELFGDRDPQKAAAGTLRAMYGVDPVRNCAHVSFTKEDALEDLKYFFCPKRFPLNPVLSNCTLCIVKPHAIREGLLGKAMELIKEGGFKITALNMFLLENINASEFMAVYKGIVPEYHGMIEELVSGPCIAMEIRSKDKKANSAVAFRKYVGPTDPKVARILRPHTMRAQLGTTKLTNAIHCSDLSEDGLLEVEYFFKILSV